jgi:hypothetical protein
MGLTGSRVGTLLIVAFGQAVSTAAEVACFVEPVGDVWLQRELLRSAWFPQVQLRGAWMNPNAEPFGTTARVVLISH